MFLGTYLHLIDDKGRLSLPRKFREVIKGKNEKRLILTPLKSCLIVHPLLEWEKLISEIEKLPQFDEKKRNFRRLLFSNAFETPLDAQGRILIPQQMRTLVGLNKEVAIIGLNATFEIWPREKWEKKYQEILNEIGDLSELHDIGI